MNVLTNLNLTQNEIQNAVIQPLAVAPSNPRMGQIYYNSVDKVLYHFNGTEWASIGEGYTLPIATNTTLGGVKAVVKTAAMTQEIGIDTDGKLYVEPYELPDDVVQDANYIHTDNNFTTELKDKLDGIEDGAEVNVIETITVNNASDAVTVSDKNVDLSVLPLAGGTMSGSIDMGGNGITDLPNASADSDAVAYGQLPTTPVITGTSTTYEGDTVTVTKNTLNIKTGATSSTTEIMQLATDENAGLMPPSSVQALSDLQTRVEALEGTTVRLLYSDKTDPSKAEIEAFVRASGYTDTEKWAGIAVVIAGTYHIWHYYSNDSIGWRDDGLDTVSQFTNDVAGIILGSNEDGQVYAENDGTGSIVGWDALKGRVTDVENNKADKTELPSPTNVAIGTISSVQGSPTSVTVAFQGTYLSSYVTNASGEIVITDVNINAGNVVFSVSQTPATVLSCNVVYLA